MSEQLAKNSIVDDSRSLDCFEVDSTNWPFSLEQLGIARLEDVVELENICCSNPWSRALLIRELENKESLSPGLIFGDSLVAQSFNYLVADELHILNISVHPQFRGMGLGKFLLSSLLLYGLSKGLRMATLEVRESNRGALGLYHKLGFQLTAVRKRYYQDNGEDALVLDRAILPSESGLLAESRAEVVQSLIGRMDARKVGLLSHK